MNAPCSARPDLDPARSFDLVVEAFDRSRPAYPTDAVAWLLAGTTGSSPGTTAALELGAGTGRLTEAVHAAGCDVVATDVSAVMLARLGVRAPDAPRVVAAAEQVPLGNRTADVVVAGNAFHWFDAARALPECARVLRPGGRLALAWTARDERVPWVRRLGRLVAAGSREAPPTDWVEDPAGVVTEAIDETGMFETVERASFRSWEPMDRPRLHDLVRAHPAVALAGQMERERLLRKADELYDDYGRGPDGMLLPYVTTVLRTTVLPWAVPVEPEPEAEETAPAYDDALLIDFR